MNPSRFQSAIPDPNFANVSLLMHFDGPNDSTVFTDSSSYNHTATVGGQAKLITADSKFGSASGIFDGAGDFASYTHASAFNYGTGDLTIEGWVKFTHSLTNQAMIDTRTATTQGFGIYCTVAAAGLYDNRLVLANNAAIIGGGNSVGFPNNTWAHWAVTRQSGTVRGFINGALRWSLTDTRSLGSPTGIARVGSSFSSAQDMNGLLDEIRITKGIARYTAAFTAPTSPFPDF